MHTFERLNPNPSGSRIGARAMLKLVSVILGIGATSSLLLAVGFLVGYKVGSPVSPDVVEFCVISSDTSSSRGYDAGDLVFADPGSGCIAGELKICGRYDGPKRLDVVEEDVESADCP